MEQIKRITDRVLNPSNQGEEISGTQPQPTSSAPKRKTTPDEPPAPGWLIDAVKIGFKKCQLAHLGRQGGRPSKDEAKGMIYQYALSLRSGIGLVVERHDAWRIVAAFDLHIRKSQFWPKPSEILDLLPAREITDPLLPEKHSQRVGDEDWTRNKAKAMAAVEFLARLGRLGHEKAQAEFEARLRTLSGDVNVRS